MLVFTLTMPNNNSWNNKWSGSGKLYVRARKEPPKASPINADNIKENHYYNFGDGWGANVNVRVMPSSEANKLLRKSEGFCGYDWMIDSILQHNKIVA